MMFSVLFFLDSIPSVFSLSEICYSRSTLPVRRVYGGSGAAGGGLHSDSTRSGREDVQHAGHDGAREQRWRPGEQLRSCERRRQRASFTGQQLIDD